MPKPLTILALDTCTETCSAALTTNGKVFALIADAPREHSQRLLPMVDDVLAQAQVTLADVDMIAYGRGPGSFTGIRICTSMTQLAISQHNACQVLCCIDARMNEVYWGQYIAKDGIATLVGEEHVSVPEAIELILDTQQSISVCGTGFEAYPELLNIAPNMTPCAEATYPDAKAMLILAQHGYQHGLQTSVDELAPVYLRDTVTWKKLPGRE